MKVRTKSRHEKTVDWLVNRLMEGGKYTFVQDDIEYHRHGYVGQVDVLTYRKDNNTYYFWEIKSSNNRKGFKKAKEQYKRYCMAHPRKRVKGIYVTPYKIKKLADYVR